MTGAFLRYVGPRDLHDATVVAIKSLGTGLEVALRNYDGEAITVIFEGVSTTIARQPEGMIIYALAELAGDQEERRFIFVDTHEGEAGAEERGLKVLARDVRIAPAQST